MQLILTSIFRWQLGYFEVADGEYMCEVKNFANGTRNITVNIRATTRQLIIIEYCRYIFICHIDYICSFLQLPQLSKPHYLRFSTLPVTEIQTQLYLDSEEFVIAMFESMVCDSYVHTFKRKRWTSTMERKESKNI